MRSVGPLLKLSVTYAQSNIYNPFYYTDLCKSAETAHKQIYTLTFSKKHVQWSLSSMTVNEN